MSACSVVPGLNVRVDQPPPYEPVAVSKNGAVTEYLAQVGDQVMGYRVVEISGRTLAQLRAETDIALEPLGQGFDAVRLDRAADEYRMGPGDIVLVTVWDHPELSSPLGDRNDVRNAGRLILSDGSMFYPYVGSFTAAGMTVAELRVFLTDKLERVINHPQLDVRVAEFRSQRVQVTGDIRQPGTVILDDTAKGVLEAINERGGLSENASRRRVLLSRDGQSITLDLAAMMSGDRPVPNVALRAGDVIHVPDSSNDLVFVLGETSNQKQIVLQQGKTTLTQALTEAGGLDKARANDAGVLVFRRPNRLEAMPTIYTLDLDNPLGLMLAGELVLQPRDVVYVKPTGFAKYNAVINQLLPTISAIFQIDRLTTNR
ncbi:polysaccharide biosynthesis/export family protein [Sinimarinibacterium sp. NLF-5-8]|uniref:polysaccharide biosynthesis/export family protein n=1 Tax=Sinimarinibacterium sp. NLF-5-8 TaxID=2698684 RepID=UPI00137BC672|nr:polysaccharide biosynthesis/export family protein [Sinimarinibacterium sp. NLF-5-8]QHS09372.1 polysaccharide export protein Wza [Sinimarinibacterium sp. NLF-5-8]